MILDVSLLDGKLKVEHPLHIFAFPQINYNEKHFELSYSYDKRRVSAIVFIVALIAFSFNESISAVRLKILIIFPRWQHNADVKLTDHEGRTCLSYVNSNPKLPPDSSSSTNYSVLRDLLINSGCPDTNGLNGKSNNCAGTLSRQKNSIPSLDKLPSSVI